ncbi:DUF1599 domain-containing protein [Candidatus Roizmanbacteria bacterium]|nr:DUF1599 domain-containing protein [Candidatus Roizmanbacteria bacterium]
MTKKPKYLDESFEKVCEELLKIFIKKHKDYGKNNILDTGETGVLYRISDKINRLKHLLENGKKPTNETIEDNWLDIAVYGVIAILYRRGWFKKLILSPKAKK